MKDVVFIELVLENCESIEIVAEHMREVRISDITRSIRRIACNSVSETVVCEHFFATIEPQANVGTAYTFWSGDTASPFGRLTEHSDITALSIRYRDGSSEYIYVPWGGDYDYINDYQRVVLNDDGSLTITIDAKEDAI
ncbi:MULTISPECIES: hypothetical protein [Paenibacillus]|uniref:Cyclophilin-like domain-containing protein n=1 Tax=Paenibacillus urinalis TaxID=521520 RepID=A0ABY7XDU8_9BACL|nr:MULTISPECIES: hypothetical protein [Paenibacillus]WDI03968.1 hypothetical protein PUW25_08470 [Paenibacillus urinalis]SDW24612.1 hypothetical protein SAMN05518848_101776 [Paenibacillus sp. PDC88]